MYICRNEIHSSYTTLLSRQLNQSTTFSDLSGFAVTFAAATEYNYLTAVLWIYV